MDADPNNETNNKLRTLVLSTNVNDYDTGEPILDGSIMRKTMTRNKILQNKEGNRILHDRR